MPAAATTATPRSRAPMRNRAPQPVLALLLSAAAAHRGEGDAPTPTPAMTPMLFMLPSDTHDPWGLQFPIAPPPVNLSAECAGASCYDRPKYRGTPTSTIIAVFDRDDGAIDVVQSSPAGHTLWSSITVGFTNFTGKQNRTYFLKEDLPPKCHIKDFAKKPGAPAGAVDGYLLALFCEGQPRGHNGAVFLSGDIHTAGSFRLDPLSRFNFTTPNFHDHDVRISDPHPFTSCWTSSWPFSAHFSPQQVFAYHGILGRTGHPSDPPGRALDRLPDFIPAVDDSRLRAPPLAL